jgi:hypothetical protein
MLGLTFDMVGAFMVSVEAIRLENLRLLRDRFLKLIERYTISPRITFIADKGGFIDSPSVPADGYPGVFMGLHYVAGLAFVVLLNLVLGGRLSRIFIVSVVWAFGRPWYVAALLCILFTLGGIVAGLWALGELVHMALTKIIEFSMRSVDFIDANTPNGTVGVIGFVLLLVGFALQMCGAYLGRTAA